MSIKSIRANLAEIDTLELRYKALKDDYKKVQVAYNHLTWVNDDVYPDQVGRSMKELHKLLVDMNDEMHSILDEVLAIGGNIKASRAKMIPYTKEILRIYGIAFESVRSNRKNLVTPEEKKINQESLANLSKLIQDEAAILDELEAIPF